MQHTIFLQKKIGLFFLLLSIYSSSMNLIINPSDIYYLTWVRFHDPGEILLLLEKKEEKWANLIASRKKKKEGIIFCDPRTSELFDKEQYDIIDERKNWGKTFSKYTNLSTDPDFLTQSLREKIEKYGVKLAMKKSPISQKRIIKTSHEIELLRESQKLNKKVYEMILPFLTPGVTEEYIARKIQIFQLELWASGASFSPVVAFGENSAVPHHSPTERKLQSDDVVLVDMGLVWRGYCSDMTRCLQIKKEEEWVNLTTSIKKKNEGSFDEIYTLLQNVTNSIISCAKPGMKVSELDKKARKMLGKYAPYFTHSLGHGVGIDIHEAPRVSSKSKDILRSWMVITIEPGVYIPGKYGARYEEMVYVDKDALSLI